MSDQSYDAERVNREQREFWNNAAPGWKQMWSVLERAGQPVSDRLVELARVAPGNRVLDIATGSGEPGLTAARRVGPGGLVVATDQSPAMLELARERAAALGLHNVKFVETGAEELAVGESGFDAALCRWGLMFMPDLASALTGIRARIKTGGHFATSVWSTPDKVPMITAGVDAVRKLVNLPPPPPNALDPLRLADTSILKNAMEAAGFKQVMIERLIVTFEMESPEAFAEFRRDVSAPFRALLDRQTPEMRERVLVAVTEAARKFVGGDGKVRTSNETILFSASN